MPPSHATMPLTTVIPTRAPSLPTSFAPMLHKRTASAMLLITESITLQAQHGRYSRAQAIHSGCMVPSHATMPLTTVIPTRAPSLPTSFCLIDCHRPCHLLICIGEGTVSDTCYNEWGAWPLHSQWAYGCLPSPTTAHGHHGHPCASSSPSTATEMARHSITIDARNC